MKDKLLDKVIRFDLLLGLVALVTALVAAFFSVYGIATLFSGAIISVAVMATMLEISKLVGITYLYRYWKQTKKWLAAYLSLALVVLMIITSLGIFGYLSSAYQKASTAYKAQQEQIVMVEKTKTYAQNKIDQAQTRIIALNELRKVQEARMSEAMTNAFISRNAISLKQLQDQTAEMIKTTEANVKTEQSKIESGIVEMSDIEKRVSDMKYADTSKDIRTFEFVAKLFGTDLDTVAKWFIFALIVVFDPLAIALLLAYNVVTYKKEAELTSVTKTENVEMVNSTPIMIEHEDKKKVPSNRKNGFPLQKIPKIEKVEKPISEKETSKPHSHPSIHDSFAASYFKQY